MSATVSMIEYQLEVEEDEERPRQHQQEGQAKGKILAVEGEEGHALPLTLGREEEGKFLLCAILI